MSDFATTALAPEEYNVEQIASLVTNLRTAHMNEQYYRVAYTNAMQKLADVETYLKDNREELELHADEIAEILGVTLTRKYRVAVTVTNYFEIETEEQIDESWVQSNFYNSASLDSEDAHDDSMGDIEIDEV